LTLTDPWPGGETTAINVGTQNIFEWRRTFDSFSTG